VKIFFDEDNGTGIPKALLLLRIPGTDVLYPGQSGRLRKGTSDPDWLRYVGAHRFLAFSQNRAILQNDAELQTLVAEKVGAVFLTTGQERSYRVMRLLLNGWEWLEEIDATQPRPFAYELTITGRTRAVRL